MINRVDADAGPLSLVVGRAPFVSLLGQLQMLPVIMAAVLSGTLSILGGAIGLNMAVG